MASPRNPDAFAIALAPSIGAQARDVVAALVEAMRPKQWIKNVFVLAGLVFGGHLFDAAAATRACACFALFCGASSAVYLFNDTLDRSNDAHHPTKRLRPIASGRLPVGVAVGAAALLAILAIAGSFTVSRAAGAIVALYLVSSAAYTLGLKRVFILDVMIVASGFVLRAAAGAAAVAAKISPWLICCTVLLALYLALGKRRNELAVLGEGARHHRDNLASYSIPLLDGWLTALSAATIVCYALYTQSPRTVQNFHTTNLLYTVPFVIYALFRYQHLVQRENGGGDPGSSLVHDRGMVIAILGWAAMAASIVYAR